MPHIIDSETGANLGEFTPSAGFTGSHIMGFVREGGGGIPPEGAIGCFIIFLFVFVILYFFECFYRLGRWGWKNLDIVAKATVIYCVFNTYVFPLIALILVLVYMALTGAKPEGYYEITPLEVVGNVVGIFGGFMILPGIYMIGRRKRKA